MKTKKIKILGTSYTIKLPSPDDFRAILEENDFEKKCSGYTDLKNKLIIVENTESLPSFTEKVVAHEILHALLYEGNVAMSEVGKDEEKFVMAFEMVFARFLKDNTKFFKGAV